jgi:putative addiction module CopG family antidote
LSSEIRNTAIEVAEESFLASTNRKPKMTIQLTPEQTKSIQTLVQTGAYRDDQQVIDEAIRLLVQREQLRVDIQRGIDDLEQGRYRDYGEDELDILMDDIARLDEQLNPDLGRRE